MDYLHKVLKWVDHNRYKAFVLVVVVAVSVWLVGCEPMTSSVVDGRPVAEVAFETEVATKQAEHKVFLSKTKIGRADLQKQREVRQEAFDVLGGVVTAAATGTLTPQNAVGSAITMLGLIGIGAIADKRRLDKKVEKKEV